MGKSMYDARRLPYPGAVDADGHVLEPTDLWERYIDPRFRDRALRFVVDDEGSGIPEAELAEVFAPFYRLERSRSRETGGAGLGLSVARTIIHAHGGEIVLANRSEGGLRASIRLPR